ncbi:hypothetical protein WAI453_009473 [Rhynchosporium graminicola]
MKIAPSKKMSRESPNGGKVKDVVGPPDDERFLTSTEMDFPESSTYEVYDEAKE